MTEAAPPSIPAEPGRWRAITLAALVHLALLALLWIGVRWQNETPLAVEAEVWNMQAREAAPPAPAPQLALPPPPKPEPVIAPKAEPAPKVVTPPAPKPDIALEREKQRKQEAEKQAANERQEKLAEHKRQEKLKQDLAAAEAAKRKKAEEEQRRKLDEEKRKLAAAEALKQKRLNEADTKAAEARHQENLKRLQAQAGGSGDAPKSQGVRGDPSYAQKIGAKIKSNTVFNTPDDLAGNPAVEYDVQLLPDGSLRGMRKLRSSGVPGFDDAVARAIERSQPFPPDRSGNVPSGVTVSHKPKDQ